MLEDCILAATLKEVPSARKYVLFIHCPGTGQHIFYCIPEAGGLYDNVPNELPTFCISKGNRCKTLTIYILLQMWTA